MKKITIALIMVISLIAPIQTMAESVTQNGTIIEPLEQNIEQIIDCDDYRNRTKYSSDLIHKQEM